MCASTLFSPNRGFLLSPDGVVAILLLLTENLCLTAIDIYRPSIFASAFSHSFLILTKAIIETHGCTQTRRHWCLNLFLICITFFDLIVVIFKLFFQYIFLCFSYKLSLFVFFFSQFSSLDYILRVTIWENKIRYLHYSGQSWTSSLFISLILYQAIVIKYKSIYSKANAAIDHWIQNRQMIFNFSFSFSLSLSLSFSLSLFHSLNIPLHLLT